MRFIRSSIGVPRTLDGMDNSEDVGVVDEIVLSDIVSQPLLII